MNIKLIACEILYREFCHAAAGAPHKVDVEFLPKGLHDVGTEKMQAGLIEALDQVDQSRYDAVALGYGLCNNGIVGLGLEHIPLVVPRAHDCITLFLGCRHRYEEYFFANGGVYFKTSGWIERGEGLDQFTESAARKQLGLPATYEEMVAQFGEDNARYLQEQLGDLTVNYDRIAYIAMGLPADAQFETVAQSQADEKEWGFERLEGDMSLIHALLSGNWDNDLFLVVPPGGKIEPSYNADIVQLG